MSRALILALVSASIIFTSTTIGEARTATIICTGHPAAKPICEPGLSTLCAAPMTCTDYRTHVRIHLCAAYSQCSAFKKLRMHRSG